MQIPCSFMETQCQGHTSRSWNLPFIFLLAPYLLFSSNVPLSVMVEMSQPRRRKVKVMGITLQFHARYLSSKSFERFLLNFTQIFPSLRLYAGPMPQLCRLKVMGFCVRVFSYPSDCCLVGYNIGFVEANYLGNGL